MLLQHLAPPLAGPRTPTQQRWRVKACENGLKPAVVMFGTKRIPVDSIWYLREVAHTERDVMGQFVNFVLYMALALAFAYAVYFLAWRWQFLFGTAMFAAVALMALADVVTTTPITTYRLDMTTRDGTVVRYTTTDQRDRDDLTAAIDAITPIARTPVKK